MSADKAIPDDLFEITVPTIRFLGMNEPITLQFHQTYLKLAVRVIVVWMTFLLFKPRMAKAWNIMFGDPEEANRKRKEIQERIAFLEAQREKAEGSETVTKKSYAVATGPVGSSSASPADKGAAKKRKA